MNASLPSFNRISFGEFLEDGHGWRQDAAHHCYDAILVTHACEAVEHQLELSKCSFPSPRIFFLIHYKVNIRKKANVNLNVVFHFPARPLV